MEYRFSTIGGYRNFFVTADSKEQAIRRFKEAADKGQTSGFQLSDVPIITEANHENAKV